MKTKIDKIYIIHRPDLVDRKAFLESEFSKLNFDPKNIEWMFNYYSDHIPPEVKVKYYNPNAIINESSMKHIEAYRISHRILSDNYIVVMLEHLFALQKAVLDNINVAMIVEDDVIFCDNFSDKIVSYMNQLPDNWDVFYPGEACNQRLPQTEENKNVYLHPQKSTRTSYFYIMKIETIKRILSTIIPFTLAVDFELTYQYWNHNMNVYWGEPSLSKQGSETGKYRSLFCKKDGSRI